MNQTIGAAISISKKEVDDNVKKESYLSYNVQYEEILWQASEETKLHWSETG